MEERGCRHGDRASPTWWTAMTISSRGVRIAHLFKGSIASGLANCTVTHLPIVLEQHRSSPAAGDLVGCLQRKRRECAKPKGPEQSQANVVGIYHKVGCKCHCYDGTSGHTGQKQIRVEFHLALDALLVCVFEALNTLFHVIDVHLWFKTEYITTSILAASVAATVRDLLLLIGVITLSLLHVYYIIKNPHLKGHHGVTLRHQLSHQAIVWHPLQNLTRPEVKLCGSGGAQNSAVLCEFGIVKALAVRSLRRRASLYTEQLVAIPKEHYLLAAYNQPLPFTLRQPVKSGDRDEPLPL
mmetsp:Transcript_8397/g.30959  ORF Transcript_8397/g.30959 Transcript_8397/m.30959 type:complete len:297 (+) Transcript_8397:646-1536(+)